jgi:hypothetical protein
MNIDSRRLRHDLDEVFAHHTGQFWVANPMRLAFRPRVWVHAPTSLWRVGVEAMRRGDGLWNLSGTTTDCIFTLVRHALD